MFICCFGTYAPSHDRAENLWYKIGEKRFSNLVFKSMHAVEDTFVEALVTLENVNRRRSIMSFGGITGIPLSAKQYEYQEAHERYASHQF